MARRKTFGRSAKDLIRRAGLRVGVDIRRYREDPGVRKLRGIRELVDFDAVIDVGANTGQFGEMLRASGFGGRILSFEPLSAAHERLRRRAARDPAWVVGPRVAIGEREGEVELNVSENSVSSSVLAMLEAHESAAPEARYVGTERVRVARLDDVSEPHLRPGDAVFLKIDAQGYERQVLTGAPRVLDRVRLLQIELSLVPLYADQPLFGEMFDWLRAAGFTLLDLSPAFLDDRTGRALQVDGFFGRGAGGRP